MRRSQRTATCLAPPAQFPLHLHWIDGRFQVVDGVKLTAMSRAFVKDADESVVDELPDRPISSHPNLVTPEGLAAIEAGFARLQQEHARALASGDRACLAATSRELRYWRSRRASAQVVATPVSPSKVQFGCSVTILRDDGRQQTYRIVGEDEADPSQVRFPSFLRSDGLSSATRLVIRPEWGTPISKCSASRKLSSSFT